MCWSIIFSCFKVALEHIWIYKSFYWPWSLCVNPDIICNIFPASTISLIDPSTAACSTRRNPYQFCDRTIKADCSLPHALLTSFQSGSEIARGADMQHLRVIPGAFEHMCRPKRIQLVCALCHQVVPRLVRSNVVRFASTQLKTSVDFSKLNRKWEEVKIPVPWGHIAGKVLISYSRYTENSWNWKFKLHLWFFWFFAFSSSFSR